MDELTAHRVRWQRSGRINLRLRNVLLSGVFVSWMISLGLLFDSSSTTFYDLETPFPLYVVERRRLRVVISILFLLHVTVVFSFFNFIFEFNWRVSSPKTSIGIGLASAILLSLALGLYLGWSKNQQLHTWSSTQSRGLYSGSALFAVNVLVQTLLRCLEAWWIPKALRVPFHNEPTVRTWTERNNDNGPVTPITDGALQRTSDAGPLERLFAQQSSSTSSTQSIPEEQSTTVPPSRINSTSVGGPQLHPVVVYWAAQPNRKPPGTFILIVASLGTFWAPIEISVFSLGSGSRAQRPWIAALEFAYPFVSAACFIITCHLILCRIPLRRKIIRLFRLDYTLLATASTIVTAGMVVKIVSFFIEDRFQNVSEALKYIQIGFLAPFGLFLVGTFGYAILSISERGRSIIDRLL